MYRVLLVAVLLMLSASLLSAQGSEVMEPSNLAMSEMRLEDPSVRFGGRGPSERTFPSKSPDQNRERSDGGLIGTNNIRHQDWPDDPEGASALKLCEVGSKGTRHTDKICKRDNTGTYYFCAIDQTLSKDCDLYTYSHGLTTCKTCSK